MVIIENDAASTLHSTAPSTLPFGAGVGPLCRKETELSVHPDDACFPLSSNRQDARLGMFLSCLTGFLTLLSFVIAIMTPPLSGPFCVKDCIRYPFTDAVSRFPRDFYWMYPSILAMLLVVALLVAIHQTTPAARRIWSQMALSFGLMASGIVVTDYFLQLSVIQPSLLNGETDGLALLTQYNPHGIFIALEEVGYLLLCLSLCCLAPVFWNVGRLGRAISWTSMTTFGLSLLSLVGISIAYGVNREYRFEIAVISFAWIGLIVIAVLVALIYRRSLSTSAPESPLVSSATPSE